MSELPIIVKVPLPEETPSFDLDRIDTEIWCVNTTAQTFTVLTRGDSFTTVDEETGVAAKHGSRPTRVTLPPGGCALVADVAAWEWDGAVGIVVAYLRPGDREPACRRYDMRDMSGEEYRLAGSGKTGLVVKPWPCDDGSFDMMADAFRFRARVRVPRGCRLWTERDRLTRETVRAMLEPVKTYEDDSHLLRQLLRCTECGSLYFFEFYEEVDWQEGNDPQYSTWIPVADVETADYLSGLSRFDLLEFSAIRVDFPASASRPTGPAWIVRE